LTDPVTTQQLFSEKCIFLDIFFGKKIIIFVDNFICFLFNRLWFCKKPSAVLP